MLSELLLEFVSHVPLTCLPYFPLVTLVVQSAGVCFSWTHKPEARGGASYTQESSKKRGKVQNIKTAHEKAGS